MGIHYSHWLELTEELNPYAVQCANGEMTFDEYAEIVKKKCDEFIGKYSKTSEEL